MDDLFKMQNLEFNLYRFWFCKIRNGKLSLKNISWGEFEKDPKETLLGKTTKLVLKYYWIRKNC